LTIFFIFPNLFGNFDETKQGKVKVAKQSVVEHGSQLQDEPVCGAIDRHTIYSKD
jgi:hypothetical protein